MREYPGHIIMDRSNSHDAVLPVCLLQGCTRI